MIHISASNTEGVYYYMLFYLAAILIGITGAGLAARSRKFSFSEFAVFISVSLVGLLIGSKLIMFDRLQWEALFLDGQLPIAHGKSVLGAIAGGMIGLWLAGKLIGTKESLLDLFAVSFPLGMAVQRIGCLISGCCHGICTSQPWGITYGPASRPFIAQQQLGLIPEDAVKSLAIHPVQIYNIIACIIIAFIAWKTRLWWKSPSGRILFSLILFLAFRFIEEFSRFALEPGLWLGIKIIQWKVLILLVVLALIFFYRERKYAHPELPVAEPRINDAYQNLKLFLASLLTVIVSFQIGDWLTGDERMILALTVFPLCGWVIAKNIIGLIFSQKYVKTSMTLAFALILMSQKSASPTVTPDSYTSFNVSSAFGKFKLEHELNYSTYTGTDCNGAPATYSTYDYIPYTHSYGVGGIGISRKKYMSPWISTTTSIDIYGGKETEKSFNYSDSVYTPPVFNNALVSVNPMVQYDARGIGFGIGGSFGLVSYDKRYTLSANEEYEPKYGLRNYMLQGRLRLFSERFVFLEWMSAYDGGSVGDYTNQVLIGSRFNSEKYLLKIGIAGTRHSNSAFVLHGQMPLGSNLFFSPEIIIYPKEPYTTNTGGGYRAVIGLQYRMYDNEKKKSSHKKK